MWQFLTSFYWSLIRFEKHTLDSWSSGCDHRLGCRIFWVWILAPMSWECLLISSSLHLDGKSAYLTGIKTKYLNTYKVIQTVHKIQAYFILLLFYWASQILCFLQIEGLWQSCIKQVYSYHFSNSICSLCASVSHFGSSHTVSNFLIIIIFVLVIFNKWPLMLLL